MKTYRLIFSLIAVCLLSQELHSQCVTCQGNSTGTSSSSAIGYGSNAQGLYTFSAGLFSEAWPNGSITLGSLLKTTTSGSQTGEYSIVIGSGFSEQQKLTNSQDNTIMFGCASTKPTLFISKSNTNIANPDKTGKIGIGDVTSPLAKLHLKADAGETSAIFIQPNNWMAGESANLLLGTTSLGISSDYNKGFVFKSANDYLFKDGKMGIGAFSSNEPEAKLHVKSSSGEEASIFIEPYRDDLEGGIEGESAWTGNLYLGTKTNIISGVSGLGLLYSTSQYHAFQGGNFGIGTLEPLGLFHVKDQGGDFLYEQSRAVVSSNGFSASLSLVNSVENQWEISHVQHNGTLNLDHTLNFEYNDVVHMAASDEEGLYVHNNLTVCDLEHGNPYSYPPGSIHVYHDQTVLDKKAAEFVTHDGGRIFFVPKVGNGGYNYLSSEGDVGIFWSNTTSQTTAGGRFIIAPHYTGTEDIYSGIFMTHEGNVGIHVREPSARLDVKNRMQISGWDPDGKSFVVKSTEDNEVFVIAPSGETKIASKLWAQEVEVVVNVWKDHVFYETYKLRPLKEVESFIKENKHLPDVPSEKDVKENGLNLGEMDAIMLQKIEELTLYIIEQDKKIERLNERIEELSIGK